MTQQQAFKVAQPKLTKEQLVTVKRFSKGHRDVLNRLVRNGDVVCERRGHRVFATDGHAVVQVDTKSSPIADKLVRLITFWAQALQHEGPLSERLEAVVERAKLDLRCELARKAVRAYRRGEGPWPD